MYAELVAKHGKLDPLAIVNMEPANSVAMTVVCGDKEALFDIPTKQTIGIVQCVVKFCSCKGNLRFVLMHLLSVGVGPGLIYSFLGLESLQFFKTLMMQCSSYYKAI